ncbi:MAG: DNA polymerase III subunit gamma/tau [Succinivibrio sp.]|nr:DNA polymerase III subunit gamma/tau [Succinivibrio sp.]
MAEYQALARKYRPQSFADVVGQGHVKTALCNTIDARRLHHAYLLTGTRGIGKTTIARIIAKCLECEDGITSSPNPQNESWQEITQGTYPDVIEIDAASQTKVEDTRQLLENTMYPPVKGRYKIYIIDEVHMLSASSFNALLKTLEEPPSYVKFILATTDPHKIPPTVLSRCLQFQLQVLSREEIREQILKIAKAEGIACESEAADLLARAARGSMRDALSLCDQAVAQGGGSINASQVTAMLGTAGDKLITQILDLLSPRSELEFPEVLSRIRAVSPNYRNLLDELVTVFHDLALYQLSGNPTLEIFSLSAPVLKDYAARFSPQDLQRCYQIVLEAISESAFCPDEASAFDMCLLRLCAFAPQKKKPG